MSAGELAEWKARWPGLVAARAARPREAGEGAWCRVCSWSVSWHRPRWVHDHVGLDLDHAPEVRA